MVRGFPKKDAAEDFYLANKLVKISSFQKLENLPISLSPRLSRRVPFGTGMSLQKIAEEIQENNYASTYNPQCFSLLEKFVSMMREQIHAARVVSFNADHFSLSWESREILDFHIQSLDVDAVLSRLQGLPLAQREQRFTEWFDALKILRFVNHCHRHLFEPVAIALQ